MKLIVGLGNPGNQYNLTRHNFGFLALDFYAKKHDLDWKNEKMGALWTRHDNTLFVKPQLFYNESGTPVQNFLKFYKIPLEDTLILCDDFNLSFGTLRYRAGGSAGGNNGLKSIIASLGSTEIPRLRLGTGNPALRDKLGDVDFVLSRFTPEEKAQLPAILTEVTEKLESLSNEPQPLSMQTIDQAEKAME